MLDLNALESFVIAAETCNFSKTAELRHTVQSAVSTHIRKLETEIGHALFERGRGQSMRLTPEGRSFLVYARRILNLSDEAVSTLRGANSLKTIRLGTTVTLAMSVVPIALQAYADRYPDVKIEIFCERSDALLPQLDVDNIDIAFMMDQGKRADRVFVESDELVWVAGQDLVLDSSAGVPLVFFTDGRDLRKYAMEALDRTGRQGFVAHSSPHPIGVRSFVLANLAVTVMPSVSVVAPMRVLGSDDGLPRLSDIGLSLYKNRNHERSSSSVADLVVQLREALRWKT